MESPNRRILSQVADWPRVSNSAGHRSAVDSAPHHDIKSYQASTRVAVKRFPRLLGCRGLFTLKYGAHGGTVALSE